MADPVSSVKHVMEMALKIKHAVETVQRNKDDCLQIRRRVIRVSDILSLLQETENMLSNPAISAALEDLADTLHHAHTLVVSCQEKNMVCLFCAATTLSKKLRRVNDDISDQVMVGIWATTVHVTIALSQIQDRRGYQEIANDIEVKVTDDVEQEIANDIELTLPKKEEPMPPPPPMEQPEPEPEPPPSSPEDRAPPLPLLQTPPPPPIPPAPPAPPLVVVQPPCQEPKPTPPLLQQSGGVPAPEYSGFSSRPRRRRSSFIQSEGGMTLSRPILVKQKLQKRTIMKLSYSELEIATHNFATRIGQGGFGAVYKGVLRDGLEVSIKKHAIAHPNRYDEKLVMHRLIQLCSMLEHKNIVKVLGYCHENRGVDMSNENAPKEVVGAKEEFLLLVEEYMANGNLSNCIYGEQLDWSSRFRIIQGITQGIIYLHTHSGKPTIVHLDLKPDNILLDSDMNPKIADFGLAKVLKDDEINASIRGTLGYMPPEYIVEGVISVKNDVYGYGVTLLETISGMSESGRDARHQASIEWAWNARKSGAINKLFDPRLCDESQLKEIKRCMDIGLLCTQNKPTDRPTMPDVLEMLQGKKKVPPPKQPGYIKRVRAARRYKQA